MVARSVYGHVIIKFSRMGRLLHFLTHGAPLARFAINYWIRISVIYNNTPFYRYGGHFELIRLKEYYRMPRGHEHISFVLSSAFRDSFS